MSHKWIKQIRHHQRACHRSHHSQCLSNNFEIFSRYASGLACTGLSAQERKALETAVTSLHTHLAELKVQTHTFVLSRIFIKIEIVYVLFCVYIYVRVLCFYVYAEEIKALEMAVTSLHTTVATKKVYTHAYLRVITVTPLQQHYTYVSSL
jgi:hypothetical protein